MRETANAEETLCTQPNEASAEEPFASWRVDHVKRQSWYVALNQRVIKAETSNRELAEELDVQKVRAEARDQTYSTL